MADEKDDAVVDAPAVADPAPEADELAALVARTKDHRIDEYTTEDDSLWVEVRGCPELMREVGIVFKGGTPLQGGLSLELGADELDDVAALLLSVAPLLEVRGIRVITARSWAPELAPVISSNLRAMGYHEGRDEIWVQFSSGTVYSYDGTPKRGSKRVALRPVYDEIKKAPSVGRAFHALLRGRFLGVRRWLAPAAKP